MHRPLTEHDLFPHGALVRLGRQVRVFAEIDSTNGYLLAHADELPDGSVAVAEFQSAGRGRQGRRWLAPRGSSLLLSVLLHEPAGSALITHAGTLAALAAAEAVETETSCRPELRWPNDLVVAGRKLGGVLVESTPLGARRRAVVIGIGLNCFQQRGHFEPELKDSATSLELECAQPIDRAAVGRRLIERLDDYVRSAWDDPAFLQRLRGVWADRCHDLGARVVLIESGRQYAGTVLEIAEDGSLVVQLDSGMRRRFEPTTTTRIA